MRRARRRDNSKLKKRVATILISFVTILAMLYIVQSLSGCYMNMGGCQGMKNLMSMMNGQGENYSIEGITEPVPADGKINILLLGVDNDGLRTDTIILASYDLNNKKVNMLSIPRDTRMYVGGSFQKINSAHATKKNGKIVGAEGTIEAVSRLTGMPIHYYVEFTFDAFRNTIDALGGVEFDVPQRMRYTDPVQDLYINLQAGLQTLDGDKAEQLVRFRQYPRGDIQRVETQQAFIKALAEQKLNVGIIDDIPELFGVLAKDIKTNFTLSSVVKYIPNLKELSAENIKMYQLPGNFSGEEYIASYWIVDMAELKELVAETFDYPEEAENATTGGKGVVDRGSDMRTTTNTTEKATTDTKKDTTKKDTTKKDTSKDVVKEDEKDAVTIIPTTEEQESPPAEDDTDRKERE